MADLSPHNLKRMWHEEVDWLEDFEHGAVPPKKIKPRPTMPSLKGKRSQADGIRSMLSFYRVASFCICIVLIGLLLFTATHLPAFGAADAPANNEVSARYIEESMEETGAVNVVCALILNYRGFDTMGESFVLFTAATAVAILLRVDKREHRAQRHDRRNESYYHLSADPIVSVTSKIIVPNILLFGVYILLFGHLSPGGGFSGGAVIGSGLILYAMVFGLDAADRILGQRKRSVIILCALLFYCVSKGYSFFTGANHLHSFISSGVPGRIISAGLLMPLNIAVGLVVSCTMFGFYSVFRRGKL